jgi:hypothetical protein
MIRCFYSRSPLGAHQWAQLNRVKEPIMRYFFASENERYSRKHSIFYEIVINAVYRSMHVSVQKICEHVTFLWNKNGVLIWDSKYFLIFFECHHMSLMDFVVSPPGCGRSVTDFWYWDAHEAQLRCPDEVDGDIWIWSTRRGLKPKFYRLPRPWSLWGSSLQGNISTAEPGIEPGTSRSVVRNSDH